MERTCGRPEGLRYTSRRVGHGGRPEGLRYTSLVTETGSAGLQACLTPR